MKKEIMEFSAPQQKVTVCNGGKKALVLFNERVEERVTNSEIIVNSDNVEKQTVESTTVYVYDGYWISLTSTSTSGIVEAAKRAIIEEINKYDSSNSVNEIFVNGKPVWVDKNTRMGLRQNIADKKALGQSEITVWMEGMPITISCDNAEKLMCSIENYAYECFNVTEYHKSMIEDMTDLEKIMSYDITMGYPPKIRISL